MTEVIDESASVAAVGEGGFVVSCTSAAQDGSGDGIYSQRYYSDGVPLSTIRFTGGIADDHLVFSEVLRGRAIDLGEGTDTLELGSGDDKLSVENVETVNLGDGDNILTVEGEGDAFVTAGDGDDQITSGEGDDTLVGGAGNDRYVVNSADDVVIEAAGEGTAKVISTGESDTGLL